MLEGNYIIIKYKDKIVCRGKVISSKTNYDKKDMKLISIDEKYYFNLENKDRTYAVSDEELDNYICLDDITLTLWKECFKFPFSPVYEEFTIYELDKEVIPLVQAMNKINHIKTTGSCSGHDNNNLWIDFICDDFNTLKMFLNLFNYKGNFKYDWNITTIYKLTTEDKNGIILELRCKHKGQQAYDCAENLAKYLEILGESYG